MQVKTFRAPTIGQALEQVKRELGQDAIILSNRKVALSAEESVVEVMVALEQDAAGSEASSESMRDGIEEIKGLLSLLISSKDTFARLQLEEPVTELYHSLLTRGLDEKQTFLLLKKALRQAPGDSREKDRVAHAFRAQLAEKIRICRPFGGSFLHADGPQIYAFVGPTGVGKTTTLAKLAAHLKIKRRLNPAVISLDTYRIGAVDQLRTYADILAIPLVVAQSREEFHRAVEHLRGHSILLVDTIGRNYLRRQHVTDLAATLGGTRQVHSFLVLNATAKDEDLKQTIQHFRPLDPHSLIFTKLDETMSHGCIVNQLLRFPYGVSYLGTGQRVPEDIEAATHKRLLSLLIPSGNGSSRKE